jgi:ABC-type Fe3+-siderophore transport system permease subunit
MTSLRYLVAMWLSITVILSSADHYFHARTGILHYNWTPTVDGQSVWAWLIFAGAAAAMLSATMAFPLSDIPSTIPWTSILGSTAIFVAAYGISGKVGATHPTALGVTLVLLWLVRVALRPDDRLVYLTHGATLAVAGVVGEGLFSMAGLFDYRLQQVVDCPWWLAGLYLNGSIALLHIARGAKSLRSPAIAH